MVTIVTKSYQLLNKNKRTPLTPFDNCTLNEVCRCHASHSGYVGEIVYDRRQPRLAAVLLHSSQACRSSYPSLKI